MGQESSKHVPAQSQAFPAGPGVSPKAGEAGSGTAAPGGAKFFSVTQYNKSVERLLKSQVPQVWVKGVITQFNVRGRLVYITLGEFGEEDAKPKAVLEATMWSSELELFNLRFSRLPMPLALRVELKVAFLMEANFYVPSGRFQPRVLDVDENFTVGELSLTRQKIIAKLSREGLLERNKGLALSDWPLRVGLITAPASAAYHDFTTVLLQSGYAFRIYFAGAKMQGEATESTVLRAFAALARHDLDVICLVRGGGAKTDLVYFDSEPICRAIAACPVPVLTGIGHEIDHSLADLASYGDKITPTDCAKFLESRVAGCYARLCAHAGELSEAWHMECQEAWHDLGQRASLLRNRWEGRRGTEEIRCRARAKGLSTLARQILREENRRMAQDRIGLRRGPRKIMRLEKLRFANKTQAMGHAWDKWRAGRENALRETFFRLRERAELALERAGSGQTRIWRSITAWWRQALGGWRDALLLKERLVQAADPGRALALGFSLLRNRKGEVVRNLAQVSENEVLINQLRDGSVESRVIAKKESS